MRINSLWIFRIAHFCFDPIVRLHKKICINTQSNELHDFLPPSQAISMWAFKLSSNDFRLNSISLLTTSLRNIKLTRKLTGSAVAWIYIPFRNQWKEFDVMACTILSSQLLWRCIHDNVLSRCDIAAIKVLKKCFWNASWIKTASER